jgi:GNAT superfamily N-acetyltransferase
VSPDRAPDVPPDRAPDVPPDGAPDVPPDRALDVPPDGAPELIYAVVEPTEAKRADLREQLLEMWVDVTNAGGAVGFTPPADATAVARTLDSQLARVSAGTDLLGILRQNGTAVGMAFLVDGGSGLRRHWRTVLRLMVRPELQGRGAGRLLLEGLHGTAADLGLEQLMLTTRGGTGVERFYERFGYTVVGRHPGAIRLAPGDDRDEIILIFRL